ncbi:hypothetical protein NSA24_12735 [Clostridioides mangenotii]|nr:hypothetical protein [Clostridioides mangenotii]MCR1955663.1 hypothetical protein [Clostridioides mangenotii]
MSYDGCSDALVCCAFYIRTLNDEGSLSSALVIYQKTFHRFI